jgi:hypothetical protein
MCQLNHKLKAKDSRGRKLSGRRARTLYLKMAFINCLPPCMVVERSFSKASSCLGFLKKEIPIRSAL